MELKAQVEQIEAKVEALQKGIEEDLGLVQQLASYQNSKVSKFKQEKKVG